LYYAFLQAEGALGTGLDKNELHLCKVSLFGDLVQIVATIAKYISSSGLSIRIPHLAGEEMFGSTKCKVDLPPRLKANSHQHD